MNDDLRYTANESLTIDWYQAFPKSFGVWVDVLDAGAGAAAVQ
jgi:hypothetical protein